MATNPSTPATGPAPAVSLKGGIGWGLRYIKQRYGRRPIAAEHDSPHWYDRGAALRGGDR